VNQLIELQQRLIVNDSETNFMAKELNLIKQQNGDVGNNDENEKVKKRKHSDSDDESGDDKDEDDEDEEDEEIYSDTDEEMRANEEKKVKKQKKVSSFVFNPLKPEQFEEYLAKFNREYQKYK
jgi:TATA-binding protein-associated factor Taf7